MRHLTIMALIWLGACTQADRDELARSAARQAIRPVLAQQLPGVPLEPAIDCVIDNASAGQLLALAADAVTGPTQSTFEVVNSIVSQPETLTCLAVSGLPALLL